MVLMQQAQALQRPLVAGSLLHKQQRQGCSASRSLHVRFTLIQCCRRQSLTTGTGRFCLQPLPMPCGRSTLLVAASSDDATPWEKASAAASEPAAEYETRQSVPNVPVAAVVGRDASDGVEEVVVLSSEAQPYATTRPALASVSESPSSIPAAVINRVRGLPVAAFYAAGGFAALTFVYSLTNYVRGYTSSPAQRRRTVNKNKLVVDSLNEYLPANREALSQGVARGLRMKSGFSAVEVFRKYLWYLLRERQFNPDAVADMLHLKAVLGLSTGEVAEALKERAQRIYDKYGNVMLDVAGMTKAGIERKATCRALFSKLLYLSEDEDLLGKETNAASKALLEVFGATEEDADQLRIVSLYEVDMDKLDTMATTPEQDGGAEY